MRKLTRPGLSARTSKVLTKRQMKVDQATPLVRTVGKKTVTITEAKDKARSVWNGRGKTVADREVLTRLALATGGKCSYCESNDLSDVDHFYPLSAYPERSFKWCNFVGACAICNRRKSDQFREDPNGPVLLDPFEDELQSFFGFSPETGKLIPLGDKQTRSYQRALYTEKVLNLKGFDKSRKIAWHDLCRTIICYVDAVEAGDEAKKADLKQSILHRHNGLLIQMKALAQKGRLSDELCKAFRIAPEITTWLDVAVRDRSRLDAYCGQIPDEATLHQSEICLDFGMGNQLVLCRFSAKRTLTALVNIFRRNGLTDVTASATGLELSSGDVSLSLHFGKDQCMFLVEDDRLTAVW